MKSRDVAQEELWTVMGSTGSGSGHCDGQQQVAGWSRNNKTNSVALSPQVNYTD
jgi:hypothetical protein